MIPATQLRRPPVKETVILVHGLWMHGMALSLHARWLRAAGFAAHCFSYASVRAGLAETAARLGDFVAARGGPTVHLVGHSLGGLVVLELLARRCPDGLRRAVLMGSPVRGSHCARRLLRHGWTGAMIGRGLAQWQPEELPALPAQVEIGVIAGTRSIGMARIIPGLEQPNDGAVALAETHLPEARDSIALPVAHSQMLVSGACSRQVIAFLRSGRFLRE